MIVGEYASKFNELMKYFPYYRNSENGEDIYAQFKNGLRADIHTMVSVFQLTDLPTLVFKCHIYETSAKGKQAKSKFGGPLRRDMKLHGHHNKPYQ